MQIRPIELRDAEFLQRSEGNPVGWESQEAWLRNRIRLSGVRMYIGHIEDYSICWGEIDSRDGVDELRWKVQWPHDRGHGYGKQFARKLLEQTSAPKVIAKIACTNIPSMRIAIDLGMKPERINDQDKITFAKKRKSSE